MKLNGLTQKQSDAFIDSFCSEELSNRQLAKLSATDFKISSVPRWLAEWCPNTFEVNHTEKALQRKFEKVKKIDVSSLTEEQKRVHGINLGNLERLANPIPMPSGPIYDGY